jgi:hypothetical protein
MKSKNLLTFFATAGMIFFLVLPMSAMSDESDDCTQNLDKQLNEVAPKYTGFAPPVPLTKLGEINFEIIINKLLSLWADRRNIVIEKFPASSYPSFQLKQNGLSKIDYCTSKEEIIFTSRMSESDNEVKMTSYYCLTKKGVVLIANDAKSSVDFPPFLKKGTTGTMVGLSERTKRKNRCHRYPRIIFFESSSPPPGLFLKEHSIRQLYYLENYPVIVDIPGLFLFIKTMTIEKIPSSYEVYLVLPTGNAKRLSLRITRQTEIKASDYKPFQPFNVTVFLEEEAIFEVLVDGTAQRNFNKVILK